MSQDLTKIDKERKDKAYFSLSIIQEDLNTLKLKGGCEEGSIPRVKNIEGHTRQVIEYIEYLEGLLSK